MSSSDPSPSCRPTKVEVPQELPKVSMVNTSLKKLKHHLVGFDVIVKERTTATAITEGLWGFEHTKACFRDEIIPFVKALRDIFNTFDQYLIDELTEVQNVFHQMEQAVDQHRKGLNITALKDELRKLKGKSLVDNVVTTHTILLEMLKIDVEPIAPRLLNNKTAHSNYLRLTQEQAAILKETSEQGKSQNPLNNSLDTALPPRKPTILETNTSKPVVTLVYSKKPRKSKTNVHVSKLKIIKSISANSKEPSKSWVGISHEKSVAALHSKMVSLKDTNNSENLGKLQPKADIDFDELTTMAFEHSSSEPALHEMTPATISLGLISNPPPSTLFVLPSRIDWDLLFQPLFDELLNPSLSVDHPTPDVIAPIIEAVAPEPAALTGSTSSTTVDQDAPSASNSQTLPETQSPVISNDVEEENHDLDVAHMNNDPFFGIPILKNDSVASSYSDVIPTILYTAAPNSEHVTK
nr:hypothetical protein [Tanacetum cinerariifolium]